tara:strand:+ start:1203 stop:2153 length:951 start_codon:yes stop_codon:yes gene_type:complete
MKMQNVDNIPWVEKYRPEYFDDIVLDKSNKKMFKNILDKGYFPNLLFYGPPGTGKTTTIINIINEYNKMYTNNNKGSVIHLNASDERGIDTIRNQILQFVKTNNFFEKCVKFVILDEVDYMTKNAQQALKYLLQSCNYNVRFCLICNYISKIDESLKNEFMCVRFNQLPKKHIHRFIKKVSDCESLDMNDEYIYKIMDIYKSDIRSMINFIQLNKDSKYSDINIISKGILECLHQKFIKKEKYEEIIEYMHITSIKYNIDKISIIKKYLDYVVRDYGQLVSNDFLSFCEVILHTEDTSIQRIIKYMIYELQHQYSL